MAKRQTNAARRAAVENKTESDDSPEFNENIVEESDQQIDTAIVSGVDSAAPVRRLRINRVYQGAKTSEQAIITGVYYEDDPFLFGLALWLVENAYAEWVV